MKALLIFLLLLSASGCSSYDYHLAALTESYSSSTQNRHLAYLRQRSADHQLAAACGYYPQGYGGFTLSCYRDR